MGNELYTDSGTPVRLEEDPFEDGGEGLIYETSRSGLCAKVYSGDDDSVVDQVDDRKHRKLQAMVRNPPEDPTEKEGHCSFAWPEEVLYREPSGQRCVGFLMPRIDTESSVELHVCKGRDSRRERFGGSFHWRNLFTVGSNIASAVAALHEKGYCIGDINEENILVDYGSILITIIDCDSFQVRDPDTGEIFPSPVGKPEYTAPELSAQAKRYEDMKRTPESDAFALAILLFELLMENMSPYQGKGPALSDAPSTSAKLKKGLFPYISETKGVEPPPYDAPSFDILHPHLQDLFIRCFDEGHGRPDHRPTAGEWFRVLRSLEDDFRRCEKNDYHRFLDHLDECPWCKWSPPGVDDCFPSPHGRQSEGEGTVTKRDRLAEYVETAAANGTITQAERRKLREKAQDLGLKKSDLKELIRKSGATTSSTQTASNTQTASPGTPELEVEENRIQHKDLEHGATRQGSITFSNVGGGNLQGSLKAGGGGWLRTDRTSIDPSQHRQKVSYRIDTSNLAYGDSPTAHIQIRSNGGNHKIPVSVSVETPEEATKRWRTRVALWGLPAGALFGVLASSIPIPAVAGVSAGVAFLAGSLVFSAMWTIVGAIIGSIAGSFVESPKGCAAVGAPIGFVSGLVQWFSEVTVRGSPPNEFVEMLGGMGTGNYVLLSAASWALVFAVSGALPAKWWAQVKSRGDSLKKRVAGVWGGVALLAILAGGVISENLGAKHIVRAGDHEGERTATSQASETGQRQETSSTSSSESDPLGNSNDEDKRVTTNRASETEKQSKTSSTSSSESDPLSNSNDGGNFNGKDSESRDAASSGKAAVSVKIFSVISPDELTVGEEATFSATVNNDRVTAPVSYRWEFDDGTTSKDLQTTHSYSESGTYTVRFQASDDRTSDEISKTVKVEERSPTSISFKSGASATAEMEGNRFTITVVSGKAVEQQRESTRLTLKVRQKSENFDGKWVRWGHILDESYLDGPRGRAYEVDRSESENLGSGRVQPGDTRTGTLVFHVDVPPDELERVTLNFTYFPYRDGRTVEIPFSIQ